MTPKASDNKVSVQEIWEMFSTFLLPLLPSPFCSGEVAHACVQSMRKINLFKSYSYLNEQCENKYLKK